MNPCRAEWNNDCPHNSAPRGRALDPLPPVRWIAVTNVANHRLFLIFWLRSN
jgi:hypothetical protein